MVCGLELDRTELPDYESISGLEKSYSFLLTAVDEVNDFSSFPLKINIVDVPEPPYFKVSPSSASISEVGDTFLVPEEFTGSILELTPADSEASRMCKNGTGRLLMIV